MVAVVVFQVKLVWIGGSRRQPPNPSCSWKYPRREARYTSRASSYPFLTILRKAANVLWSDAFHPRTCRISSPVQIDRGSRHQLAQIPAGGLTSRFRLRFCRQPHSARVSDQLVRLRRHLGQTLHNPPRPFNRISVVAVRLSSPKRGALKRQERHTVCRSRNGAKRYGVALTRGNGSCASMALMAAETQGQA
jgi:hypothetical protein